MAPMNTSMDIKESTDSEDKTSFFKDQIFNSIT